jgi:hypothetical protein
VSLTLLLDVSVRVNAHEILKECGILIAITTRDYAFLRRRGY